MSRKRSLSQISDKLESRKSEKPSKSKKCNLNLHELTKKEVLNLKNDFEIIKHQSKNQLEAPGWEKFGDLRQKSANTILKHLVCCSNYINGQIQHV